MPGNDTLVIELNVVTGEWRITPPAWFGLDEMAGLASALRAIKKYVRSLQTEAELWSSST